MARGGQGWRCPHSQPCAVLGRGGGHPEPCLENRRLGDRRFVEGGGSVAVLIAEGSALPGLCVAAGPGGGPRAARCSQPRSVALAVIWKLCRWLCCTMPVVAGLRLGAYPFPVFLFILLLNSYKIAIKVRACLGFFPPLSVCWKKLVPCLN